jgi:hypothetical protein
MMNKFLPLVVLIVLATTGCRRSATGGPRWDYGGEFHKAVGAANGIAVRDGGFHNASERKKQKILCLITDPAEIREVSENLRFQPQQSTPSCDCVGYPGLDWYRGHECIAATSVQHCRALRWKDFPTDAVLTPESGAWLKKWLVGHGVKEEALQ